MAWSHAYCLATRAVSYVHALEGVVLSASRVGDDSSAKMKRNEMSVMDNSQCFPSIPWFTGLDLPQAAECSDTDLITEFF